MFTADTNIMILHFSQKQLPREMESRLIIIECAGYIFCRLFMRLLYFILIIIIYVYTHIFCFRVRFKGLSFMGRIEAVNVIP